MGTEKSLKFEKTQHHKQKVPKLIPKDCFMSNVKVCKVMQDVCNKGKKELF